MRSVRRLSARLSLLMLIGILVQVWATILPANAAVNEPATLTGRPPRLAPFRPITSTAPR